MSVIGSLPAKSSDGSVSTCADREAQKVRTRIEKRIKKRKEEELELKNYKKFLKKHYDNNKAGN